MKKINESLEMLCAIIEMHNANETIHKSTWLEAEKIVLKNKNQLKNPNIKFE